jgi:hypothetical protein
MVTVKQQAEALLRQLPDDCSFEDIQYELYVLEKIRNAEESIARDGGVSHEEAKQRLSKWLAN